MSPGIYKLKNVIQNYSWGSASYISDFLGRENRDNTPEAEMWMGMHPRGESKVSIGKKYVPLSNLVENDPEAILGAGPASQFGGKLPFLFKTLAAGKPLSIQAHPSLDQAREGFARENKAGIPLDGPSRNYRDDNHKPELIYALTPFWALRGFRPVDEILVEFLTLNLPELSLQLDLLKQQPDREGLKSFFHSLMTLEEEKKQHLLIHALKSVDGRNEPVYQWVKRLHREYPGDMGAVCPLLLHCIKLEPGTAMYLPAGELHAYLEGFGIELMANSDNVLRGGLTSKHIDVPELLKTLSFEYGPVEYITPLAVSEHEQVYSPPVPEFQLSKIVIQRGSTYTSAQKRNVEILLCSDGSLRFSEEMTSAPLSVGKGESVVVFAASPGYSIEGEGTVFKATVP